MELIPKFEGAPKDAPSPSWFQLYGHTQVKCPQGHYASLNHDIAADGTVTPSLVCPFDPPEHWHIWGQLVDYTS